LRIAFEVFVNGAWKPERDPVTNRPTGNRKRYRGGITVGDVGMCEVTVAPGSPIRVATYKLDPVSEPHAVSWFTGEGTALSAGAVTELMTNMTDSSDFFIVGKVDGIVVAKINFLGEIRLKPYAQYTGVSFNPNVAGTTAVDSLLINWAQTALQPTGIANGLLNVTVRLVPNLPGANGVASPEVYIGNTSADSLNVRRPNNIPFTNSGVVTNDFELTLRLNKEIRPCFTSITIPNEITEKHITDLQNSSSATDRNNATTLSNMLNNNLRPADTSYLLERFVPASDAGLFVGFLSATIDLNQCTLLNPAGGYRPDWQDCLNMTWRHELRHITYKINYPYDYLRWKILRRRYPGLNFGTSMCSSGHAHEQHNPEDAATCTAGGTVCNNIYGCR
jgi:hypothetical protein